MFSLCAQWCRVIQKKHQKTQHCNVFLFLLTSNWFYLWNSKKFATRIYLMYQGRDICGTLSLWVVFEVFTAVSVKELSSWLWHPFFFFYHEVRGGRFLHLYGGNRASYFLQNICKFLPDFISQKMKFFWRTVELCNRCSAACTLLTFNLLTPNVNYTAPLTSKVAFFIFIQQI